MVEKLGGGEFNSRPFCESEIRMYANVNPENARGEASERNYENDSNRRRMNCQARNLRGDSITSAETDAGKKKIKEKNLSHRFEFTVQTAWLTAIAIKGT